MTEKVKLLVEMAADTAIYATRRFRENPNYLSNESAARWCEVAAQLLMLVEDEKQKAAE